MSKISVEKEFSSLHVDLHFLRQIEDFLKTQVPSLILGTKGKSAKFEYFLRLEDRIGTEQFDSISDYSYSYLPESLEEVQLGIKSSNNRFFLNVSLEKTERPFVRVRFEGDQARAIVNAILENIGRFLKEKSNRNYLFHLLPESLDGLLKFGGLFFGIIAILDLTANRIYEGAKFAAFSGIIAIYWFIGSKIKTFVTFDTKAYEELNKYYSWFLSGLLSFILFGIVLTFFKNWIILTFFQ